MERDKAIADTQAQLEESGSGEVERSESPEPDVKNFVDTLPELPVMPDESLADFESFQSGMLEDLAPSSAYANVLADNIIANEWETYRLRRWRKTLLVAHAEEYLAGAIFGAGIQDMSKSKARALAKSALFEGEDQAEVLEMLKALKIDPSTSLARASGVYDGALAYFEQKLASYEGRRRRLRAEFNAFEGRNTKSIPDAELL